MSLRLGVALALAVGLGWVLGVAGTAYVLGVYDRHTDTVVRVCWSEPPRTAVRPTLYMGSIDTLTGTVASPSRQRKSK